jgi:hypothetical protein
MKLSCHSSVLHKCSIVFYLTEDEVSACDFIRGVILGGGILNRTLNPSEHVFHVNNI